ncbi:hypothetical protein D3D02_16910 [Halobellus sp. Atlit-38R]|uniref:hypothetical protein n=1 Tax=Halobellus sp. Atlit-38R TaxID=2282131 RepID=UPI000EF1E22E|nr:hypothetical protein [Halobellus sp. Atlit-38R]RLM83682.1 hypothetical protein D3D02_16910 [Halobellus sp. Atlit-38R]
MLDGLLWKPIEIKPLFKKDGTLQWLLLERHRITGATRTAFAEHPEIRAQDYAFGRDSDA